MKRVEFVRLSSELCGYGFGKGDKYRFNEVAEVIGRRLRDGGTRSWLRFAGRLWDRRYRNHVPGV